MLYQGGGVAGWRRCCTRVVVQGGGWCRVEELQGEEEVQGEGECAGWGRSRVKEVQGGGAGVKEMQRKRCKVEVEEAA